MAAPLPPGTATMAPKPVLNLADVPLTRHAHGASFDAELGSTAKHLGLRALGCRLTVVPPGKRAWPLHNHHANEELFLVLEGEGSYRLGDQRYPVRAGDLLAAPAGGRESAHQIVNDSDAPLRYLAISTMHAPDVMEYPDSDKIGVAAGAAPGGARAERRLTWFAPAGAGVDYWQGED